ncbi:MAG: sensor histidine kinase [Pseudomonadota bacterium]
MPTALPRRIKLAFIVQALIASLVLALGILGIELAVRQALVKERLADEVASIWTQLERDPSAAMPQNSRMRTYFVPAGGDATRLPAHLRGLGPGTHVPLWRGRAAIVDRREQGTLALEFDPSLSDRAIRWTGGLSLLLALAVTFLSAWLTYRTSKRMVGPVSWLANVVAHWDARAPSAAALAPANLPLDSGTEVRRLAYALRGLAGRVGEALERERKFTRDASHELRTPLTVIRVAADIMAGDPDVPPRTQRAVSRIQRAGHDMQSVIDAFMILARDAEIDAESERFDLHEIVDPEVELLRPLLAGKPVELVVVDRGARPIDAPRRVLSLMVGNLLGNAVRFTERGRIEVVLAPDRIEVRDTGIGMSAEAVEKAFDPFYREDRERGDGMGIGLSVVRRLGERMGWPVELQSQPGEGTVAVIRFRR